MKITESYLRKIIRGTLQEMMGATDGITAMGTMHDNPHAPPEEEVSGDPADIVEDILSTYQVGGTIDNRLLTKLMTLQAYLEHVPQESSSMTFSGLGENKKRR